MLSLSSLSLLSLYFLVFFFIFLTHLQLHLDKHQLSLLPLQAPQVGLQCKVYSHSHVGCNGKMFDKAKFGSFVG